MNNSSTTSDNMLTTNFARKKRTSLFHSGSRIISPSCRTVYVGKRRLHDCLTVMIEKEKKIVVIGDDSFIRIFDFVTRDMEQKIECKCGMIYCLCLMKWKGKRTLVASTDNGKLLLFSVPAFTLMKTIELNKSNRRIRKSSIWRFIRIKDSILIAITWGGEVVRVSKKISLCYIHLDSRQNRGELYSICQLRSVKNTVCVGGGSPYQIVKIDYMKGEGGEEMFPEIHRNYILGMCSFRSGRKERIASSGDDRNIVIWSTDGSVLTHLRGQEGISSIAHISGDLVLGGCAGGIWSLNLKNNNLSLELQKDRKEVWRLRVIEGKSKVISISDYSTVRIYTLVGHEFDIDLKDRILYLCDEDVLNEFAISFWSSGNKIFTTKYLLRM